MICETGEPESNSQGTYELLRKEINAVKSVPNNKGIGVFYWEPELNSSGCTRWLYIGSYRISWE